MKNAVLVFGTLAALLMGAPTWAKPPALTSRAVCEIYKIAARENAKIRGAEIAKVLDRRWECLGNDCDFAGARQLPRIARDIRGKLSADYKITDEILERKLNYWYYEYQGQDYSEADYYSMSLSEARAEIEQKFLNDFKWTTGWYASHEAPAKFYEGGIEIGENKICTPVQRGQYFVCAQLTIRKNIFYSVYYYTDKGITETVVTELGPEGEDGYTFGSQQMKSDIYAALIRKGMSATKDNCDEALEGLLTEDVVMVAPLRAAKSAGAVRAFPVSPANAPSVTAVPAK